MGLEAVNRSSGDVVILDLTGRVVLGQGHEVLAGELHKLIEAGQRKVLVNLGGVTQMDTSGISTLVRAFVTLGRTGGSLKLLNPRGHVREVLGITRLMHAIPVFDDESLALASFRAAATRA